MDFKVDLIYKEKNILGLDIGATSLKVSELKKKKKGIFLVGCGYKKLEESPFLDGVIKDPKKTAEDIKSLLKDPKWGKITAKRVNVSVPEAVIFTRVLELPKMNKRELTEAVNWEIDQYVPIPAKELNIDYEIISTGRKGKELISEVLIVAVPKKIVDSYLETIKLSGLEPYNLEMNLAAVTRAMISNKAKEEAILVMDMGGGTSGIAVYDHNIRITGSLMIGGDNVQEINSGKKKEVVFSEVQGLASEIKKLVDYYESKGEEDRKISRALLCGGGACFEGLAEKIEESIKIKVERGNPWVNISTYPLKPIPKSESPLYANSIGLSLKGIINE